MKEPKILNKISSKMLTLILIFEEFVVYKWNKLIKEPQSTSDSTHFYNFLYKWL